MSLHISPALSLPCAAALSIVLSGCPGEDPEVSTESGTTSEGTTTTVTTMPVTTMPMTTEPTTSTSSSSSDGADISTTVTLDDTSTGSSSSGGDSSSEGSSSSGGSSSGSTTGVPTDCGNGMIDAGEDCDSDDVGGVTCADQGFDDGVVACDAACLFDVTGCFFMETLQNDNGMCAANELGCTDMTGTAGNPQDMLECFQTTLTPPFDVVQVNYSIGDSVPLPMAADLIIHEWAGPGNLPGLLVDQIPLDPLTDIVVGSYDFVLPTPTNVATAGFCVGFHGEDAADGFRIDFTNASGTGESYLRVDLCGLAAFTELTAVAPGDYCIRPTVTSPNP